MFRVMSEKDFVVNFCEQPETMLLLLFSDQSKKFQSYWFELETKEL